MPLLVLLVAPDKTGHQLAEATSVAEPSVQAQLPAISAQEQSWPWPASTDAVVAAPNNHKILLENDRVRVLDVTVRPGAKEPVHSHRWPSILYIDRAAQFRDYDSEGRVLFDSTKVPPIKYPVTRWQEPQAPHAIENLSKRVTIHLVRVELKK
jgi:hypothetical protein